MQGSLEPHSGNERRLSLGAAEAFRFVMDGFSLALSPACRAFIIVPIVVNLAIYISGGYLMYFFLTDMVARLSGMWPQFLIVLLKLIVILITVTLVCLSFYLFSAISCLIASPFYGLLAQRAECALGGHSQEATESQSYAQLFLALLKDLPPCLWREFKKLLYMLPGLALCALISVIPVINAAAPFVWLWFLSWFTAVQYCDYVYDNHHIPFRVTRRDLRMNPGATFCFGALILLAMTVPVLNLAVPAAAVCAGTRYYQEIKRQFPTDEELRD